MKKLQISLACGAYDHIRDVASGNVPINGAEIIPVLGSIEDVLYRTHNHAEWDVAEVGMGGYVSRLSRGEQPYVAIPVFTSRMFRHSCIYVNKHSGIKSPKDLNGKKIGMPEWGMAAAIWCRGMLTEEYGLDQNSIEWIQSGLHEPGRFDRTVPNEKLGINYCQAKDRSLNDMLLKGEIDAIFSARSPNSMGIANSPVVRLFEDVDRVECDYWRRTGIFPIMHMISVRKDIYDNHRWLAKELLLAFEKSKNLSLERVRDVAGSYFPIPLLLNSISRANEIGGHDFWPYGFNSNSKTLETFLRYAHEQGVTDRKLEAKELFAAETLFDTKV